MQANETFRLMDEAGRSGRPFLFGIDFEMDEGFFVPDPLTQDDILFEVRGIGNAPAPAAKKAVPVTFSSAPESLTVYTRRFERIRQALMRGDSFLTNLTIATPIEMNIGPDEVFRRSHAPYKILLPGRFVCFSP